jgi:hypothetical protein
MRHAELLTDLAQITCDSAFVLHHRGPADDFQVRDLGQVGQNFILHSIGEKRVLFFVAQIFEWEHRDAFFRNT